MEPEGFKFSKKASGEGGRGLRGLRGLTGKVGHQSSQDGGQIVKKGAQEGTYHFWGELQGGTFLDPGGRGKGRQGVWG